MYLDLNDFEHQIDETILERGYDYYQDGCIREVNDLGGGDYEATVEGTEPYTVTLHLEGNKVTDYSCDCPYDWGPVCKHVAAVLYYLREHGLGEMEKDGVCISKTGSKEKETKKKSEKQQVESLLEELPADELRSFLRRSFAEDKNLKRSFLAYYAVRQCPQSKDLYVSQVQALLGKYEDRGGYVGYYEARNLGKAVIRLLDEVSGSKDEDRMRSVVYMAEAVIEEMTKMLDYSDDSDGEISGSIREAINQLDELAGTELEEEVRAELFGWLVDSFGSPVQEGWEWRFDLLDIAIRLIKSEQEKQRVVASLNQIQPSDKSWDWEYRQAQNLRRKLISHTEGQEAAYRFMESHLDNADFRKELIGQALRDKDYAKAERLAKEGINKDETEFPGLADEWRDFLLTVYLETNNTEQVIRLARYFLIKGNGRFYKREHYFKLLKMLVPQEQWQVFLEGVIAEENGNGGYYNYEHVADIYIWEEQWDKLYELLCKHPTFERISQAESYLAKGHAQELATMYRSLILDYLKLNMGRSCYKEACHYIRRMKMLGAKELADGLVAELQKTYAKRRALLEELKGI